MKIKKAVIPAAGLGSRMLPSTKAVPKEMINVVKKPAIQYIVEEAVASGIEEILIITNRGKGAMEDYFDYAPDLEEQLRASGKDADADAVHAVADLADICFLRQKETKGLGHAIYRAKSFVGNEPFGILLGDGIIDNPIPVLKQLIDAAEKYNCPAIAIREFPDELIAKYSSVLMSEKLEDKIYKLTDMNEKPTMAEKFSQYAVVDRYVLTPDIFDILEHTAPGRNHEIQLTDGMRELCLRRPFVGVDFDGIRYDTGNIKGYLETTVEFALKDPEAGEWFADYLKERVKTL